MNFWVHAVMYEAFKASDVFTLKSTTYFINVHTEYAPCMECIRKIFTSFRLMRYLRTPCKVQKSSRKMPRKKKSFILRYSGYLFPNRQPTVFFFFWRSMFAVPCSRFSAGPIQPNCNCDPALAAIIPCNMERQYSNVDIFVGSDVHNMLYSVSTHGSKTLSKFSFIRKPCLRVRSDVIM